MDDLKGGVAGGSILKGVLKVREQTEPGLDPAPLGPGWKTFLSVRVPTVRGSIKCFNFFSEFCEKAPKENVNL